MPQVLPLLVAAVQLLIVDPDPTKMPSEEVLKEAVQLVRVEPLPAVNVTAFEV